MTQIVESEPWETQEGWEQVVSRPCVDYPMAPREARRILEAAGQMIRDGITTERIVEAIKYSGYVPNPWIRNQHTG